MPFSSIFSFCYPLYTFKSPYSSVANLTKTLTAHSIKCVWPLAACALLGACTQIRDLEIEDNSIITPSFSVHKELAGDRRIEVTAMRVSGSDQRALTLRPETSQEPNSFYGSTGRAEDFFQYDDIVVRGNTLLDEGSGQDRVFSGDFTYNTLKTSVIQSFFAEAPVVLELGAILKAGDAKFQAQEVTSSSSTTKFSIRQNDVSLGFRLGMSWKIIDPLDFKFYTEHFFAISEDIDSSGVAAELEYKITNNLSLQYGYYSYYHEDHGELSLLKFDGKGQKVGLILAW